MRHVSDEYDVVDVEVTDEEHEEFGRFARGTEIESEDALRRLAQS